MASETLTSKAYRHLYGEIVDGRIAAGAVISESAIAKSLGISRTPVGEAVRLLARDGLVDQVPRFGTVVRHVQRTELDEHYEMREALESYAAQLAARRATTADITRISDLCESANRVLPEATASDAALANPDVAEAALRRFLAADMAFHLSIIQASGNAQIMRVVYTSSSISRIFATRRNFDLATVRSAHAQHREIADAIASRDGPGASAAILHHIRTSKHEAMEHFDMLARRGQSGMAELPPDLIRELREVEASMARDAGVTAEPGKPAE